MSKITAADAFELSIPERIQLVEDIWDTIALKEDAVPFTQEEKLIIDKRLDEYYKNTGSGSPWIDVKKRIFNKK